LTFTYAGIIGLIQLVTINSYRFSLPQRVLRVSKTERLTFHIDYSEEDHYSEFGQAFVWLILPFRFISANITTSF